jgi:transposase
MKPSLLRDGQWSSVLARLSEVADLGATAREYGAFQRPRKVRSAEDLLRLAFLYGPAHLSLRGTAAGADEAGIAEMSDKGVLGRLRNCGDWLEHLLQCLLAQVRAASVPTEGLQLSLVDGSVICSPTSKGADWRLHARFDPGRGGFADLVLSDIKTAERVDRTRIDPGHVMVLDRGYARVRDFAAVVAAGSDFITRIGWRSLKLFDAEGQPLDVLAELPQDDQPIEREVHIKSLATPLRLVIQCLPPEKAAAQRKRATRKAGKAGHRIDPRTTLAAGYLMLITSLPATQQSAERIVALYRNRWQVELGFKRLKTIGGIDQLPTADPQLARTWLLAHLIAAVLTEELACELLGFPPSAAPCQTGSTDVSLASLDHRQAHPVGGDPAQA